MAFIAIETSKNLGYPVEIYRFESQFFSLPYTYTSHDEDIVYNSLTYSSIPINRTQPEISDEYEAQSVSISVPRDNPLALLWINQLPPRTVWVTIERYHLSDTAPPEVYTMWKGRVRGVVWEENIASFTCQPINTALDRNGLRMYFSAPCPHMLYQPDTCKVPAVNFLETATVTNIDGLKLTSPQFGTFPDTSPVPNGWWVAGFVETTDGNLRYIVDHGGAGNTEITLVAPFEGFSLSVGDTVNIYAGCDRKYTTCDAKFGNLVNFGGWPFVPSENPFEIKIA